MAGVPRGRTFYRPGCGFFNSTMLKFCQDNDIILTLGSVYPNDPVFSHAYLNFLYVKAHLEAGDIVILHDRKWTPDMLRYLLPWMKQNGYKSVTLDEMFC
jgi:peptidoglycan/xylan/chitin deacetylase (PgdA/CDA1 family)